MAHCKDCIHFNVCEAFGKTVEFPVDDGVCLYFAKDINVPTNADRIRAMSNEELAEFIKKIKVRAVFCKAIKNNDAFEELCSAEWLKQPAEGE